MGRSKRWDFVAGGGISCGEQWLGGEQREGCDQNPKPETRNPKEVRNPKPEREPRAVRELPSRRRWRRPCPTASSDFGLRSSAFGLPSALGLRPSAFHPLLLPRRVSKNVWSVCANDSAVRNRKVS